MEVNFSETNTNGINDIQTKNLNNIINKMKKNTSSSPFLKPVDPVALGIPDYFEKIKQPMDISTIKNKLDNKEYKTTDDFIADMRLMFNNCYLYNLPESFVYKAGKDLEAYFDTLILENQQEQKRKVETDVKKRVQRSTSGLNLEDFDFCSEIIAEIEKSKHRKFTWPFLQPVTEKEVPGYYEMVKTPMDVSTIKGKLESRKYTSYKEFVGDLNLIIENCFKFNNKDSDVYKCGVEFNKLIQSSLNKSKDIVLKINELRKKINALTAELKSLESQKSGIKQSFSLTDRERIGKTLMGLNKSQAEKIAEIVQRHSAYEYIDNDEIEVNLQTIPDEILEEIDALLRKIKKGGEVEAESSSDI